MNHIFGVKSKNSAEIQILRISSCVYLSGKWHALYMIHFELLWVKHEAWVMAYLPPMDVQLPQYHLLKRLPFFYWIAFVCYQRQLCIFIYEYFWSVYSINLCVSISFHTVWLLKLTPPSVFIFKIIVTHISLLFHINCRIIFIYKNI